jgi:hypothetical protein
MDDFFVRAWENLSGRVGGPMSLRLVLQPTIAAILAIRAGLRDARSGRPLYTWSVFHDPVHRAALLRDGWSHPGGLVLVAFFLACVPYLLIRGPVNRLVRSRRAQRRLT